MTKSIETEKERERERKKEKGEEREKGMKRDKQQTRMVVHFPGIHERAETVRAKGKRPSCIPISTK